MTSATPNDDAETKENHNDDNNDVESKHHELESVIREGDRLHHVRFLPTYLDREPFYNL
eukprot:CAMPEP_0202723618 /NCGR_PEP_ID=MMETSP1385-20130828/167073_1 /ASSEMBLY_ACC=CAM_ASM_000861 /TAXON_ID=933848 /ORGANISM="Elphidium margaritaceum" /LENGTH=58 /DNA_ID=CAMNT_0049388867 /DNA_START=33 /DNA_END=206 /DNA_ORIENTATION=-